MDVESQRTQRRAAERALRSPNLSIEETIEGSCLAAVVNAELLKPGSTLNIRSDFLCPITQLIPEDAIIFGDTLYDRSSAEQIIRDSLTKHLPRKDRVRYIRNPTNPSHVIYSCNSRMPIRNEHEINNIINDLVHDIDDEWYTKLRAEVEQARTTTPNISRGSDGKLTISYTIHIIFNFTNP